MAPHSTSIPSTAPVAREADAPWAPSSRARWPEDEISFLDLFRTVARRKWTVLLSVLLFGIVTAVGAFMMKPVYRVHALLAPVSEETTKGLSALAGQFGGLAALAGVNLGGGDADKAKAVALLRSRALTETFLRERNVLPLLYEDKWDTAGGKWMADVEVPTYAAAYRRFDQEIRSVSEDKKTGLVTVAIEWKDPEVAADWTRELVDRVNREMRDRAIREAERSLVYLKAELGKATLVEVQQSIYSLVETQTKKMMLANVREEYMFQILDPPAIPDPRDKVRPKRAMMTLLGMIAGGLFGVCLALALEWRRRGARKPAHAADLHG